MYLIPFFKMKYKPIITKGKGSHWLPLMGLQPPLAFHNLPTRRALPFRAVGHTVVARLSLKSDINPIVSTASINWDEMTSLEGFSIHITTYDASRQAVSHGYHPSAYR